MTTQHATPQAPGAPCSQDALTVYYDGGCPLCRREIQLYQGAPARVAIRWADVTQADQLPQGLSSTQALSRFHVRNTQGELLSGAAAFVALWQQLPGWRYLAGLAKLPGMLWLMERTYVHFLRFRPRLQTWVRRLERKT